MTSNANFQLDEDLTEQLTEVVNDWIRLHYDEVHAEFLEKEKTYDDEDMEIREFLLYEYFNGKRSFGRYAEETGEIEAEYSIPIIQYCNGWYEDNYGDDEIMDWKELGNFDYILNQLGYVWFMENGDEIIEFCNSLGEETPFK